MHCDGIFSIILGLCLFMQVRQMQHFLFFQHWAVVTEHKPLVRRKSATPTQTAYINERLMIKFADDHFTRVFGGFSGTDLYAYWHE